jgi:hypothetical protein
MAPFRLLREGAGASSLVLLNLTLFTARVYAWIFRLGGGLLGLGLDYTFTLGGTLTW